MTPRVDIPLAHLKVIIFYNQAVIIICAQIIRIHKKWPILPFKIEAGFPTQAG